MFCQKCGSELDANAVFCSNCGTAVEETVVKKPKPEKNPTPPKGKRKIQGLLFFVLIFLVITVFFAFKFYFLPKWEKDKVCIAVQECFDALENGDVEEALTFTDYDKGTTFAEYLISEESNTDQNFVQNIIVTLLRMDEGWKSVLEYGLSNSVKSYEIKNVYVDENIAIVQLKVETLDFKTAMQISGEMLMELIENSYSMDNLSSIISSIVVAAIEPATVLNALKEILGPLYSQLSEQFKRNFDKADSRSIDIELTLEKTDDKWIIKSEEPIRLIEIYISDLWSELY